jgi:hypothetical protein
MNKLSFALIGLAAAGAKPSNAQTNNLEGLAGDSSVSFNAMELDRQEGSLFGFGTERESSQENSAFINGPGHVLVNDNDALLIEKDLSLVGDVIGGGNSFHSQENFASTIDGDVQVIGNVDEAIQRDANLLGNVFSIAPNRKEALQHNAAAVSGSGAADNSQNDFIADQSNNNGLMGGSLFGGSRKVGQQFNQVVAPNGFGTSNDNTADIRQVDTSLFGNFGMPWATNDKLAHQVNQVDAWEGSVSFNDMQSEQRDASLVGGLFGGKTARQDNVLQTEAGGDVIGNTMGTETRSWGILGKRDESSAAGILGKRDGTVVAGSGLKRRSASGR